MDEPKKAQVEVTWEDGTKTQFKSEYVSLEIRIQSSNTAERVDIFAQKITELQTFKYRGA